MTWEGGGGGGGEGEGERGREGGGKGRNETTYTQIRNCVKMLRDTDIK